MLDIYVDLVLNNVVILGNDDFHAVTEALRLGGINFSVPENTQIITVVFKGESSVINVRDVLHFAGFNMSKTRWCSAK